MCEQDCGCVDVGVCTCVHTHLEARRQPWVLFLVFEPESFHGLELTRWARVETSKPQESLSVPLHYTLPLHLALFCRCGFWGWLNSDPCPCKANTWLLELLPSPVVNSCSKFMQLLNGRLRSTRPFPAASAAF